MFSRIQGIHVIFIKLVTTKVKNFQSKLEKLEKPHTLFLKKTVISNLVKGRLSTSGEGINGLRITLKILYCI